MSLLQWSESNFDYARKLASSGLEGAGFGRDEFLQGESVGPFLTEAARQALASAAVGVCLGTLGSRFARSDSRGNRKPAGRTVAFSLIGGVIGFAAGLIWNTQGLAANAARRGFEHTRPVRDERWLERHPINYA
jgi:hypothetical protein